MYLAVLSILCAETLFFGDARLLWYAAIVWLGFHCFVLLYEEPHLRREFGDQYKTYCERVPRWWIAVYPFEKDGGIS